jgi:uncharacterized protein (TIGR02271 family)
MISVGASDAAFEPAGKESAMRTVVGLFDNVTEAQRTIEELVRYGLTTENISIVTSPLAQRALEATAHVGLRSTTASDAGTVAAWGPLRDAISGAGTLSGALQRFGLSNELAARYAAGVRQGETLESVVVDDRRAEEVVGIMQRHSHIGHQPTQPMPSAMRPQPAPKIEHEFSPDEEITIPIVREELQVGKREIQTGALNVNVKVVERSLSDEVVLREEHVDIERRAVDRPLRPDEQLFREQHFEFKEYAEQPVVSKQAHVVEEIVIHKTTTQHAERIQQSVKNTEVVFDRPFEPTQYRSHFDAISMKGGTFDDYVPAYKLGHQLRSDTQLRGRKWEDIEPNVRERWETSKPGTWEKFKDAVKHAWDRL